MRVLDVWYAKIDLEDLIPTIRDREARKLAEKQLTAVRSRNVLEHDFPKLLETKNQAPSIKDNPPLIYHLPALEQEEFMARCHTAFAGYVETLQEDRRQLLDRFELRDIAVKVVGIGSVGTWCGVMLLLASEQDPLFLQVKEARASVLEAYAGKSTAANENQNQKTELFPQLP